MMHEPYSPDHLNRCVCSICQQYEKSVKLRWREENTFFMIQKANQVFLDWLEQARRQPK